MKWEGLAFGISIALAPITSRASLTQSEQAQVRSFVAAGQVQNAARVRAMIARADLSLDESAAALRDAVAPLAFDEPHATFLRDLLFGGASAPSRPVTVVAATRALVARADALLAKYTSDLDREPRALDELTRIYRFLDADVAVRGRVESVPASAFDSCAKTLAEHVERNPRWLKDNVQIPLTAMLARAQAELALVDLTNESPTRAVDLADRLGLAGARRKVFVDRGTLLVDGGHADDAHVERARAMLERLPPLRSDVSAIVFGEERVQLAARAAVLAAKTPMEGMGTAPPSPFGDEVEPTTVDLATLDVARDLGLLAARRALDNRPDLRVITGRDLSASAATKTFGRFTVPSTEAGVAAALELVLTDAPRALELAFVRYLAGRTESATVLTDALGVLSAYAASPSSAQGLSLSLGKPRANGPEVDSLPITQVRLTPSGAVSSFMMEGHTWTLTRAAGEGQVSEIKRDGAPLTIAMLAVARVPLTEATTWSMPGLVVAKLCGAPKAGVAPGPRVRLLGVSERGYDAVATPAPADDVIVEADVAVENDVAGLAVRAAATKDGFRGVGLLFTPGAQGKVALVLRDASGSESNLAGPFEAHMAGPRHVRLSVKGTKVEAKVGELVLAGALPAGFAKGDVAFFARKGAGIEATSFSVKKR
jgi:hypothetical protein